jgi:hypothetical protein
VLQVNGAKGKEARREGGEGRRKKIAMGKRVDGERLRHAHFCAQESPLCQLLGDGKLG